MASSVFAARRTSFWIIVLGLLIGMQPITTDLYLATLPTLADVFRVPSQAIDSTLQVYLIGYASVQLFVGPLADRFGRRPILVLALALYAIASIGAYLASTLTQLNVVRLLQALGVCASVICARAIVRDLLEPVAGAKLMSRAMTLLGITALIAPIAGGLLLVQFNWQASFAAMGAYAALVGILVAWRLPETAPQFNRDALKWSGLFHNYQTIIRHRAFWTYTLVAMSSYAALMSFFTKAPTVLIREMGVSPSGFGFAIALCALGFIAGTLIVGKVLVKQSLGYAMLMGSSLCLIGGLFLLIQALSGFGSVWTYLAGQLIYMVGHGFNQPIAQTGAVGFFPEKAGAAGSVMGLAVHVGSAFWVFMISVFRPEIAWPVGVAVAGLLVFIIALKTRSTC